MAKPFQILVVLDYALVEPWNKNARSRFRVVARAIPEVAIVRRGSQVQWLVRNLWPQQYRELHWEFYFGQGSPFPNFRGNPRIITTQESTSPEDGNHQGSTEPMIVEAEGEFKYGIRVTEPELDRVISDEDPVLVVR